MRVLFVSGIDGFCHRYEVLHRAEQNAACGGTSRVRSFVDPRLPEDLRWADALFLYRVPFTREIGTLLDDARRRDLRRLGSIDDLVFVDDADARPSLDHLAPAERALWLQGVARYRATLERCDHFVAPTAPLREEARRLGWRTSLHADAASRVELAIGRSLMEARERSSLSPSRDLVLGYFSGTPTHDRDFAVAASALRQVLRRHPRVRLLIAGPLAFGRTFADFGDRVLVRETVPWTRLAARVASVDVNLAPLTWTERFSAAKGELKYIEAGAVGVPTVASPTPAFRHAIATDGATGLLAAHDEDWIQALEALIGSRDLRIEIGRAARRDVERRYSTDARTSGWRSLLTATGSPPRRRASTSGPAPSVPRAWLALEPDACPDVAWPPGPDISPPLSDEAILRQPVHATYDGLCAVDVHTVTYGQELDHRLRLALRGGDGSILAERTIGARDLPDRGWVRLEIRRTTRAGVHGLELTAEGTGRRNATSFSLADARDREGSRPPARLGTRALNAPLAVRSFVSWSHERVSSLASSGERERIALRPRRSAPG